MGSASGSGNGPKQSSSIPAVAYCWSHSGLCRTVSLGFFREFSVHLAVLKLCPVDDKIPTNAALKQEQPDHVRDHHAKDHQVAEVQNVAKGNHRTVATDSTYLNPGIRLSIACEVSAAPS